MLPKILVAQYSVPAEHAQECGRLIAQNARFTGMIRDIGGSPHVLMDGGTVMPVHQTDDAKDPGADDQHDDGIAVNSAARTEQQQPPATPASHMPSKPIFVGHGKNVIPLQKLETLLSTFQIPFKVTLKEANLGRPIPQKVKETMLQCGSQS